MKQPKRFNPYARVRLPVAKRAHMVINSMPVKHRLGRGELRQALEAEYGEDFFCRSASGNPAEEGV